MGAINKFLQIVTDENCSNLKFPRKVISGRKFDGIVDDDHDERFGGFLGIGNDNLIVGNGHWRGEDYRLKKNCK